MERRTGQSVDDVNLLSLAGQATPPAPLIVHERQADVTSYAASAALGECWPGTTVLTTDGTGHRSLLDDAGVTTTVVDFLGSGLH